MKFHFIRTLSLATALTLSVLNAHCSGTKEDLTNTTSENNSFNETYTLQGAVYDAVTGARLGSDPSFKMYLIQGTEHRTPSKLVRSDANGLLGEYAFDNIPLNLYSSNTRYKLVVTQDGYQEFQSLISNDANDPAEDFGDFDSNNNTLDSVYNKMGDVYLFPVGSTAPDIKIIVQYDGELVEGATVLLQPYTSENTETFASTGNRLSQYTGYAESLSATTDANGEATFSGENLVLGGAYYPVVLPSTYETVQLMREEGSIIIVGDTSNANHSQLVVLHDDSPGGQDDGLYVVAFTPLDFDDTVASGTLTLTFNRPIELLDSVDQFTAELVNEVTATLNADTPVDVSLSEDGLTLTLAPIYDVDPDTDVDSPGYDSGLQISYHGTIYIANDDSFATWSFGDLSYYTQGEDTENYVEDFDGSHDGLITINVLPACTGCDAN